MSLQSHYVTYLNTSYVSIQYSQTAGILPVWNDLNTSYVSIQCGNALFPHPPAAI